MLKKISNYLKTEKRSMLLAILVMILTVAAYTLYLKFVGLPMTRAHTKYNEGIMLMDLGDNADAALKFQESLSYWDTTEARQALQKVNAN